MSEILEKLEKLMDSFLEKIKEISEDQFAEFDLGNEVRPGDTIIGEMNELEKAFLILAIKKFQIMEVIDRGLFFERVGGEEDYENKEEYQEAVKDRKELERLGHMHDKQTGVLRQVMAALIRTRLDLWSGENFDIRKGFVIVLPDPKLEAARKKLVSEVSKLNKLMEFIHSNW